MERAVLGAVAAVGLMGWIVSGAASGAPPFGAWSRRSRVLSSPIPPAQRSGILPFALAASLLIVGVFLLTLREHTPFGQGQGFGRGWLIGGLAALGSAWACGVFSADSPTLRSPAERRLSFEAALRVAAPLWLVLVALAVVSLWGRAILLDALTGVMGSYVATALILMGATTRGAGRTFARTALLLTAGGAFAAALGGTVLLGTYRDFRILDLPRGTWGAVALGLGLTIAFVPLLAALLSTFLPPRGAILQLARWGATALLLLGVARGLSLKLVDESGLVLGVLIGLVAGLAAWWSANDDRTNASFAAPFAILAILAGLAASFVALQGVGSGLMLLAFWPAVLFALFDALQDGAVPSGVLIPTGGTTAPGISPPLSTVPGAAASSAPAVTLLQVAGLGAVTVLYRVVQTRFHDDLRGVSITDQYALWGFLAGALVPSLLAALQGDERGANRAASWLVLARTLIAGIVMVALPGVLTLFFGPKCALALLMGLAIGCVVRPLGSGATSRETGAGEFANATVAPGTLAAGWALFGALFIAQWTHRLLPLAELTRAQKLKSLAALLVLVVVLWVVSELSARLAARQTARSQLAPSA